MPLSIVQIGRKVRLVSVEAGHGLRSRLTAMGLVPGTEIEVLQNFMHGPFLIEVKGSRIMLGRGMAQKIEVE
jgi:Fe2+ transport system protein FeoA